MVLNRKIGASFNDKENDNRKSKRTRYFSKNNKENEKFGKFCLYLIFFLKNVKFIIIFSCVGGEVYTIKIKFFSFYIFIMWHVVLR